MYECPTCGAGLIFDPKEQMLKCQYCNNEYSTEDIERLHLKEAKRKKVDNAESYDAIAYKCTQCGATLITTDETIATFCSYCGSSAMLEREKVKEHKPKYVIPFKKTKEECIEAYRKKLAKSFFAPENMSEEQQVEKIRGIYMPYWIYTFKGNGINTTETSRYSKRRGDYVYYKDYKITTNLDAKYSGITHDATSNFSDSLSECIAPFSIKEKKDFSPTYLTGYYADAEDVDKDMYYKESHEMATADASKKLSQDAIYRSYNALPYVHMDLESAEVGLFPVYFLSTKNQKGDRISYAVINGQTGKVAAEIPIDFKKYLIASFIIAIMIFICLNLIFTVTPTKVLMLSILFNIISWIISTIQLKEICKREEDINNEEEKFAEKIEKSDYKTIKKQKMQALKKSKTYKPIIGLIIAILIIIINPVSDVYYYSGAILSIVITIWSFYDIIKELNLLTTRKLPQLEKRGGDENA